MSKIDRTSQGIVSNPKRPLGKVSTIPQPDGRAIIAGAGRDVARKDAADRSVGPKPREGHKQDWRRG